MNILLRLVGFSSRKSSETTEKQHSNSGIITQFQNVVDDTENLLINVSNVFR